MALYDSTCPGCKQPASDVERVCCGGCGAYHHMQCWTLACRKCGATQTQTEVDEARRTRRSRLQRTLVVLTLLDLLAWVLSFPLVLTIPFVGLAGYDLLSLAKWALLVPIFMVVAQLNR